MNRHITLFLVVLSVLLVSSVMAIKCQNIRGGDWANKSYYESQNRDLIKQMGDKRIKVVFIGNSITKDWVMKSPDFFSTHNYVGRGIGGQVTEQLLERFHNDVISLRPLVVVINGGINDIAENKGPYKEADTFDNIKQMAHKAHASGIKVILTSVLPVNKIHWREIENTHQKIISLNDKISDYARLNNIPYVDYHSRMINKEGGLTSMYTTDGVHLTLSGYRIMQDLIQTAIDEFHLDD